MAVVVDQKRLGGGSHSTVGTITDISPLLRVLFSRPGKPHVGHANAFLFNDPQGMCPECNGVGKKLGGRTEEFVDLSRSLNEDAVQVPVLSSWERDAGKLSGFFDMDAPPLWPWVGGIRDQTQCLPEGPGHLGMGGADAAYVTAENAGHPSQPDASGGASRI
jgi:excinuclease UvrABC ATPase subunit